MSKKSTGDLKKDQKEKKIIFPTSMKSLSDAKVWITWFIAIAFILTSGIMLVGIGMGRGRGDESKNEVKAQTPEEVYRQRLQADLTYAEEQVRTNPNDAANYGRLAEAHRALNNMDSAVENFKKAIELDPAYVPYLRQLAETYAMQEKFDDALATLDEASKKDKSDARIDVLAGNIHYNRKDYPKAAESFRTAVKKDSGEPAYYAYLAKVLEDSNRKDEAREVISEGLEIAKIRNNQQYRNILEHMLTELDKSPEDKAREAAVRELKGTTDEPEERKFRPTSSPESDASAPSSPAVPAEPATE